MAIIQASSPARPSMEQEMASSAINSSGGSSSVSVSSIGSHSVSLEESSSLKAGSKSSGVSDSPSGASGGSQQNKKPFTPEWILEKIANKEGSDQPMMQQSSQDHQSRGRSDTSSASPPNKSTTQSYLPRERDAADAIATLYSKDRRNAVRESMKQFLGGESLHQKQEEISGFSSSSKQQQQGSFEGNPIRVMRVPLKHTSKRKLNGGDTSESSGTASAASNGSSGLAQQKDAPNLQSLTAQRKLQINKDGVGRNISAKSTDHPPAPAVRTKSSAGSKRKSKHSSVSAIPKRSQHSLESIPESDGAGTSSGDLETMVVAQHEHATEKEDVSSSVKTQNTSSSSPQNLNLKSPSSSLHKKAKPAGTWTKVEANERLQEIQDTEVEVRNGKANVVKSPFDGNEVAKLGPAVTIEESAPEPPPPPPPEEEGYISPKGSSKSAKSSPSANNPKQKKSPKASKKQKEGKTNAVSTSSSLGGKKVPKKSVRKSSLEKDGKNDATSESRHHKSLSVIETVKSPTKKNRSSSNGRQRNSEALRASMPALQTKEANIAASPSRNKSKKERLSGRSPTRRSRSVTPPRAVGGMGTPTSTSSRKKSSGRKSSSKSPVRERVSKSPGKKRQSRSLTPQKKRPFELATPSPRKRKTRKSKSDHARSSPSSPPPPPSLDTPKSGRIKIRKGIKSEFSSSSDPALSPRTSSKKKEKASKRRARSLTPPPLSPSGAGKDSKTSSRKAATLLDTIATPRAANRKGKSKNSKTSYKVPDPPEQSSPSKKTSQKSGSPGKSNHDSDISRFNLSSSRILSPLHAPATKAKKLAEKTFNGIRKAVRGKNKDNKAPGAETDVDTGKKRGGSKHGKRMSIDPPGQNEKKQKQRPLADSDNELFWSATRLNDSKRSLASDTNSLTGLLGNEKKNSNASFAVNDLLAAQNSAYDFKTQQTGSDGTLFFSTSEFPKNDDGSSTGPNERFDRSFVLSPSAPKRDSESTLFYSAKSFLSPENRPKDLLSSSEFVPSDGETSDADVEGIHGTEPLNDVADEIDMKGVQFLLGHLQVILQLDTLMNFRSEEETKIEELSLSERKIRARWGLINSLGSGEDAIIAQQVFRLEYGLLASDMDELLTHLQLCDKTGQEIRWDLIYSMVFPNEEVRWGVFDQFMSSTDVPITTPTKQKQSSNWDATSRSSTSEFVDLFETTSSVAPDMESQRASDTHDPSSWETIDNLLQNPQAQLSFRQEYDVTDAEFAAILRHLAVCKATKTQVQWDKIDQILGGDGGGSSDDESDYSDDESEYTDTSDVFSVNNWTAESVADESYVSVYPTADDCKSEITFMDHEETSAYGDEASLGSYSIYTFEDVASKSEKESDSDVRKKRLSQMPPVLRVSMLDSEYIRPIRKQTFHLVRSKSMDNATKPQTHKRFASTLPSIQDLQDSAASLNASRASLNASARELNITLAELADRKSKKYETSSTSSVASREPIMRRYHSASAAIENLAEALVSKRVIL